MNKVLKPVLLKEC